MTLFPRRLLALCFAAATLAAPAAASALFLEVDLDGDGVRDRVETGVRADQLVLHLSTTAHPTHIRLHDRVVAITGADLDHDGDTDIIAATAHDRLRIWMNHGRGRFRVVHPRHVRASSAPGAVLGHIGSDPRTDDVCDGGAAGLTPSGSQAGRSCASSGVVQLASTTPLRFRSRASVPRGPPAPAFS